MTASAPLSSILITPWVCFLLAIPFSATLSRTLAAGAALLNLSLPVVMGLAAVSPTFDSLAWLKLGGWPLPLQADAVTFASIVMVKIATAIAILRMPSRMPRTYLACVFASDFALSGGLLSADVFGFVLFSFLALIPMALLQMTWGGGDKGPVSQRFLLLQTLSLSLTFLAFLLVAAAYQDQFGFWTGLPLDLSKADFPLEKSALVLLLAGLWIRCGLFPFHGWLWDTLSLNAPGCGLILALGWLPSGLSAFHRFAIPLFPRAFEMAQRTTISLALLGACFSGLLAWRQNDAYRVVGCWLSLQASLTATAFFLASPLSWTSAVYHTITQFLASGALLLLFESLQPDRGERRYGGWSRVIALTPATRASLVFFVLCLVVVPGSPAFPGTFGLINAAFRNTTWAIAALGGAFLGAAAGFRFLGSVIWVQPEGRGTDRRVISLPQPFWILVFVGALLVAGLHPALLLGPLQRRNDAFWAAFSHRARFLVPPPSEWGKTTKRPFLEETP